MIREATELDVDELAENLSLIPDQLGSLEDLDLIANLIESKIREVEM